MAKQGFDLIIFDLDSTLVTIEGLDWLAAQSGKGNQVSLLTRRSMDGLVRLEEVFARKVDIIAPSRDDMAALGKKYCESVTEDGVEVVALLQELGKEVWVLTGNFQPAAQVVARYLGIPKERVIANTIYFGEDGRYQGFNRRDPLSRSGGKAEVVQKLKDHRRLAFVGDSVTDLVAQDHLDLFVGYGGVVCRELVRKRSRVFILSKSLSPLLLVALTDKERRRVEDLGHGDLIVKAERLHARGLIKLRTVIDL